MKKKKNIIIALISFLIILILAIILFFILKDDNKLTVAERNWLNDNINKVQNINIVQNANIFGKDAEGVFYDFLQDFQNEYNIEINPITFNIGTNPSGITLGVKSSLSENDTVFYKDHFVIVAKDKEIISNMEALSGRNIGVISSDASIVSKYLKDVNGISFTQYENSDALKEAFNTDLKFIAVPLIEYLDYILSNNYHIVYHVSDANIYYTLQSDDSTLSRVLVKYFNNWSSNLDTYFKKAEFKTFTKSLNITDTEIDTIQSVEYNYGFVNTSPYEVIMGGEYGGIIAVYLRNFSDFCDIDINFNKYKNYDKFTKAIKNNELDLYFNYYNFTDNYYATKGIPINYAIVARRNNLEVINSLNSLENKTVYVLENSLIYDYLKNISNLKIEVYENAKELAKLNKKDVYIVMDANEFNYYNQKELNNYTLRYTGFINNEYQFKVKTNSALYKLLDTYMEVSDYKEFLLTGLNNHYETVKSGNFFQSIAEYIIYIVLIAIIIILLIIRKSRKVIIAKKIRKDDKLKFIDQLTSLKNRNFLNENITIWNNNTIYPQTIIVIDLNKIQEINDMEGYNEGDRQIKSGANILIKTQLDNSEIMRTDGNEFVIYLVGYSQKQVTNYIHKLNKEFKKLPYEYGAEFGYSMIIDDIKTIEDALNEAVDEVKKQKSDGSEKQAKK